MTQSRTPWQAFIACLTEENGRITQEFKSEIELLPNVTDVTFADAKLSLELAKKNLIKPDNIQALIKKISPYVVEKKSLYEASSSPATGPSLAELNAVDVLIQELQTKVDAPLQVAVLLQMSKEKINQLDFPKRIAQFKEQWLAAKKLIEESYKALVDSMKQVEERRSISKIDFLRLEYKYQSFVSIRKYYLNQDFLAILFSLEDLIGIDEIREIKNLVSYYNYNLPDARKKIDRWKGVLVRESKLSQDDSSTMPAPLEAFEPRIVELIALLASISKNKKDVYAAQAEYAKQLEDFYKQQNDKLEAAFSRLMEQYESLKLVVLNYMANDHLIEPAEIQSFSTLYGDFTNAIQAFLLPAAPYQQVIQAKQNIESALPVLINDESQQKINSMMAQWNSRLNGIQASVEVVSMAMKNNLKSLTQKNKNDQMVTQIQTYLKVRDKEYGVRDSFSQVAMTFFGRFGYQSEKTARHHYLEKELIPAITAYFESKNDVELLDVIERGKQSFKSHAKVGEQGYDKTIQFLLTNLQSQVLLESRGSAAKKRFGL